MHDWLIDWWSWKMLTHNTDCTVTADNQRFRAIRRPALYYAKQPQSTKLWVIVWRSTMLTDALFVRLQRQLSIITPHYLDTCSTGWTLHAGCRCRCCCCCRRWYRDRDVPCRLSLIGRRDARTCTHTSRWRHTWPVTSPPTRRATFTVM